MRVFTKTSEWKKRRKGPGASSSETGALLSYGAGTGAGSKGVALIMVLVLTTVLAGLATDLQNETSVNLKLAANARDQLQAQFHAKSAVELEMFFLRFHSQLKGALEQFIPIPLFEMSSYFVSSDTMKGITKRGATASDARPDEEDRPRPPPRKAPVEGEAKITEVEDEGEFGNFEGSFWVEEVVDENRKVNINSLDPLAGGCQNIGQLLLGGLFDDPKFDALFEKMGDTRDPVRNRLQIIANITDWMDANDSVDPVCPITGDTSRSGATEDTRYNHLPYNVSYKPKNALFTSVEELRLVPGINDAFMKLFSSQLTVWTNEAVINMATADELMIRAIIRLASPGPPQPGDEERLKEFMVERQKLRALPPPLNKLTQAVFEQLIVKVGLRVDPAKWQKIVPALRWDDATSVYKITAVGRVGDATSTMTVVWRDNRNTGDVFYWREE